MFESIVKLFKRGNKNQEKVASPKDAAKERLHLVLMQDRANVSVDFLELMKQEIIDVIKKYIEVDEKEIDVQLKNKGNEDGTTGAPILYANIPVLNIKNDVKIEEKESKNDNKDKKKQEEKDKKSKKSNEPEKPKTVKEEKAEKAEKEEKNEKAEEMIKEAEEIIIDDSETREEEDKKVENLEKTEEETLKSNKE